MSLVVDVIALSFVHRVIIYQSHFVARQLLVAVSVEMTLHVAIPDASFQHSSLEELALADIHFVGSSEDERTITLIDNAFLAPDNGVVIEQHLVILDVQYQGNVLVSVVINFSITLEIFVVDNRRQLIIVFEPELQFISVRAMREERHVPFRCIGLNHEVNGHALVRKVAFGFRFRIAFIAE